MRRAGELVCWILGVEIRPSATLTPAEQQAPALAAVARALAAGSETKASDAFQALREAAGRMAQRDNLEPSRAEISRYVRGLTGALPSTSSPVPPPVPPQRPVAAVPGYTPAAPAGASPFSAEEPDQEAEPPPTRPRPSRPSVFGAPKEAPPYAERPPYEPPPYEPHPTNHRPTNHRPTVTVRPPPGRGAGARGFPSSPSRRRPSQGSCCCCWSWCRRSCSGPRRARRRRTHRPVRRHRPRARRRRPRRPRSRPCPER